MLEKIFMKLLYTLFFAILLFEVCSCSNMRKMLNFMIPADKMNKIGKKLKEQTIRLQALSILCLKMKFFELPILR